MQDHVREKGEDGGKDNEEKEVEVAYKLWNHHTAQSCSPIVTNLCRDSSARAGPRRKGRRHNRKDQMNLGVHISDHYPAFFADPSHSCYILKLGGKRPPPESQCMVAIQV